MRPEGHPTASDGEDVPLVDQGGAKMEPSSMEVPPFPRVTLFAAPAPRHEVDSLAQDEDRPNYRYRQTLKGSYTTQPVFQPARPLPDDDYAERATTQKFAQIKWKPRIQDIAYRMRKQWRLPRPELLLFFIDVEPSEKKMQDDRLSRELSTLAEKIKVLATTAGKHKGRPALLDMVRQQTDPMPPKLSSVALRAWDDISEDAKFALERSKEGLVRPGLKEELGGDHTFIFKTDANTQDSASESLLPDIIKFRQQLEAEVLMWNGTTRLPAVCLLVGGGKMSWDYMVAALKKKIPVIVLADSGGLAQDLYELRQAGDIVEDISDDGQFQQRLHVKSDPKNLSKKFPDLLLVLRKFKYIQFYSSEDKDSFEDVLYKALIKAHFEKELAKLLKKTLDLASHQKGSGKERSTLTDKDRALNVLQQALDLDCPDVVESLLDQGFDLETDFKPQVKCLYEKVKESSLLFRLARNVRQSSARSGSRKLHVEDDCVSGGGGLDSPGVELLCKATASAGHEKGVTIAKSRRVVSHLLLEYSTNPLKCKSGRKNECKCECRGEEKCCMEVCQELFLWAVLNGRGKMAEVFWKAMPERMTSALIASTLFSALEKKARKDENKNRLSANAKRFEELAKGTLDKAYQMNAKSTHQLLSLRSTRWNITHIEDLAFDFASKEFVASEAFSTKLDREWRGDTEESTVLEESEGEQDASECGKLRKSCTSPAVKFILAQLFSASILVLYAFVILFQTTPQRFTPAEIVLCLWVFSLAVQELFQMFPRNDRRAAWLKVKNYFKVIWNKIDFLSIILFILGMVLRFSGQKNWNHQGPSPDDVTEDMTTVFHLAQVILSLDFVLFVARRLQVFCMFPNLGMMVTMIFKMLRDLVTFMVILILVCLAYAVTSHAILYPNGQTPLTLEELFEIPAQAYWSTFGDLSFVETLQAQPVEDGVATCSFNRSVVARGELPACPDSWSRYLVPVMLGFYVMMANVLLLNLLVAIFGKTYESVKERANVHWRWEGFVVVREFQRTPLLPPPLSILSWLWGAASRALQCKRNASATEKPENEESSDAKTATDLFEWEKEVSDKFVDDQKSKEEDTSVNAINSLTRTQQYIMTTLWDLERSLNEMQESMP